MTLIVALCGMQGWIMRRDMRRKGVRRMWRIRRGSVGRGSGRVKVVRVKNLLVAEKSALRESWRAKKSSWVTMVKSNGSGEYIWAVLM